MPADMERFVKLFPAVGPVLLVHSHQFDPAGQSARLQPPFDKGQIRCQIPFFGDINDSRPCPVAVQDFFINQFSVDGHEIFFNVAVVFNHQATVDHTQNCRNSVQFSGGAMHPYLSPLHALFLFSFFFLRSFFLMVPPNNPKRVRRRTVPSKNEMRKSKSALCASDFCNEVLRQNRPCRTGRNFQRYPSFFTC